MSTIIPDEGLNWVANKSAPGVTVSDLQYVSIGTGTALPASDDTSLDNQIYQANIDDGGASIQRTSSTGTIRASITVSAGTEVPAGADITELGVLSGDFDLVYREVRDVITIDNGERVTFEFTVAFIDS